MLLISRPPRAVASGHQGPHPSPRAGDQLASVIEARRRPHSENPGTFADMIETLFPNAPKREMFARGELVSGWDR